MTSDRPAAAPRPAAIAYNEPAKHAPRRSDCSTAAGWPVRCAARCSDAQTPADEPETRAEALQREREQKQQEVEPYEKNAVERGMILAERRIDSAPESRRHLRPPGQPHDRQRLRLWQRVPRSLARPGARSTRPLGGRVAEEVLGARSARQLPAHARRARDARRTRSAFRFTARGVLRSRTRTRIASTRWPSISAAASSGGDLNVALDSSRVVRWRRPGRAVHGRPHRERHAPLDRRGVRSRSTLRDSAFRSG